MTELEQAILRSLIELDTAVRALAGTGPKADLLTLFKRLDELTLQLPRGTDPNLLHYLHKKSYEKARLLLQGRDTENAQGTCR